RRKTPAAQRKAKGWASAMAGHRRKGACRTRRRSALRVRSRHRKTGKPGRASRRIEHKNAGLRGFPDRRSYRATHPPSFAAWWPNSHSVAARVSRIAKVEEIMADQGAAEAGHRPSQLPLTRKAP